ncbi:MAG TPA: hypothetical protein VNJ70_03275 [Thermoanaerobaculia bacterium]|nr:hypothetical protein [Thermoanaerobaculia bacterium]
MKDLITVLSLTVALLAVFVGPFVTWRTTCLKLESDRRTAWAAEVRQKLAEFLGKTLHYFTAGFEDRDDVEYLHIDQLRYELELLLDPQLSAHATLIAAISTILGSLKAGHVQEGEFIRAHTRTRDLGQALVVAEWVALAQAQGQLPASASLQRSRSARR